MNGISVVTRALKYTCLVRGHAVFELLAQLKGNMLASKAAYLNGPQNGASSDSSQTSALPLEASSTSSSIESLIYSLCAKRSHSVKVGFSRSCSHHHQGCHKNQTQKSATTFPFSVYS